MVLKTYPLSNMAVLGIYVKFQGGNPKQPRFLLSFLSTVNGHMFPDLQIVSDGFVHLRLSWSSCAKFSTWKT